MTGSPDGGNPSAPQSPRRGLRSRLLVIPAVAAPLLALLGVLGSRFLTERSGDAECRQRLEQLGRAAGRHAEANGGVYPHGPRALEEMILRELHHRRYAVCPVSGATYRWTERPKRTGDPAGALLAWEDPQARPHGLFGARWRVLYVRGRVAELTAEQLQRALAEEQALPRAKPAPPGQRRPGLSDPDDAVPPGYVPKLPPGTRMETKPGGE